MSEEKCQDCRFWRRGYRESTGQFLWLTEYTYITPSRPIVHGECRVRAPEVVADRAGGETMQRRTHPDDWCGEFKRKDSGE